MKTAGQILKAARVEKNLSIEEVAKSTRIRKEYLNCIESDNFSKLPSGVITRGFISNYSKFLGLNPEQVLAVFRRDFVENQKGEIVPRSLAEPIDKGHFWTPKTTVVLGVTLLIIVFSGYLFRQYLTLTGPPTLKVTSPDGEIAFTSQSSFLITGSTDPQATIEINGEMVALEKGGTFSLRVLLKPGSNLFTIEAIKKNGKRSKIVKTISLTEN